jgi:hypothetical protein
MARAVREGTDPEPPMTPGEYASLLTRERIVDLAGRIFDSARRIRVVLVPAEEAPIGAGEPQD